MLDYGREICGVLPSAERREWLVTNGIGGYAMGTIAGTAVIANAVMDALKPYGTRHLEMPYTAEKVYRAMHASNGGGD